MKSHMVMMVMIALLPTIALAETVDIKDVQNSGEGTTTIEIHKGQKEAAKGDTVWEVQDGSADVAGDATAMESEARRSWKKACDDWRAEFRKDNKENKIISLSCGQATCGGDAGKKTCASTATYKIKTRMN